MSNYAFKSVLNADVFGIGTEIQVLQWHQYRKLLNDTQLCMYTVAQNEQDHTASISSDSH